MKQDQDQHQDYIDRVMAQWSAADPELDVTPLDVFGRLHRVYVKYSRIMAATFAEFDITQSDFEVLAALKRTGQDGPVDATELAEQALVRTSDIPAQLRRLEDADLVERGRSFAGPRSVQVRLTSAGEDLIKKLAREHFTREAELLEKLSTHDREVLSKVLRRLSSSLGTV
ncbi:MAG TPA: MarR family transcriptional regulator [Candidatus Corynebacterium avicola]|uniref:MarR family transcriptional regulator n=1 Tax=Candidatus Corynebacterium avicola TaxID=2838527 RepID=A0A9D1RQR8_9CORY|nr:MarR family transcriptional regulator [Candidatus Corynebacterium avicola]